MPGDRGLWLKTKCLNREEFVVVGRTDPEGNRRFIGALLLGYYDQGGRLIYAGRVGTGMRVDQLAGLLRRLRPLQVDTMPLDVAPRRSTRLGSPLVLSRANWARPELVAEVKYLAWTEDGLLRQVVYEGLREDKPARKVVRGWGDGKTTAAETPGFDRPGWPIDERTPKASSSRSSRVRRGLRGIDGSASPRAGLFPQIST